MQVHPPPLPAIHLNIKVRDKKSVIKHEHPNGATRETAEVKSRLLEYLSPYLMGKGIAFHVLDTYSPIRNFS
jgi:hypothetical protein